MKQNFFSIWNHEAAYVLGFFAADGSMLRNRRGGCYIEFNGKDRNILVEIRKALGSNNKISKRVRPTALSAVYRLQLGNRNMFDNLLQLGFTQAKSKAMKMPHIPKKYAGSFVRGYFDGDGCVYFKRLKFADRKNPRFVLQIIFTSGSRLFLHELKFLLHKFGINGGSVRNKIRGYDLLLSHKDSVALFKLMYHTSPVKGLYLPRKYKLFSKAISTLYPSMRW